MTTLRWIPADDDGQDGPAPDGRRSDRYARWRLTCCGQPRALLVPLAGQAGVLVCAECDFAAGCTVPECGAEHGLWPDAIARLRDVWPRA